MKTHYRETKQQRIARFYERMYSLGLNWAEIETLRRAQLTLHRWAELECGDGNNYASWSIERDETTGKPFKCVYPHSGKSYRIAIADREKGALRRIAAVLRNHSAIWSFYQTDPRGCALYVGRTPDTVSNQQELGAWIEQNYNQGIGVCI